MSTTEDLPTYMTTRKNSEPLTIWITSDMKEKYDHLRRAHDIRVSECLRRVIREELDRLTGLVDKVG